MELSKQELILLLELEFARLSHSKDNARAAAIFDQIELLKREDDPSFYVDLFWRYSQEGLIPHRAAALGALYSFIVSHDRHPIEAQFEGFDVKIESDSDGMVKLPAWIVKEIFHAVATYLTENASSLNAAFDLPGGKKGSKKINLPLSDLNTVQTLTTFRVRDVERGGRGAISRAASEIEELAISKSKTGEDASGYEEKSVRNARKRMRSAFAIRDHSRKN